MPVMRAKMRVNHVEKHGSGETLHLNAVAKSDGYPADGSDENNTYAKWTPAAELKIQITNPELIDKFQIGQHYYVDFTQADQ